MAPESVSGNVVNKHVVQKGYHLIIVIRSIMIVQVTRQAISTVESAWEVLEDIVVF